MSKMMNVAQAMVSCLKKEGVSTIFGYPGAVICPFYDALIDSGIKHVLVRQEQNAGHSASGYARITGKPGVCVVTSGPGATNLVTAIATAYADSIPIVAISGQVDTNLLGRDVFQEVDITGSVEPFVKHSYLVKNPNEIAKVFKEAFYIAGTGRPGSVLIDIPIDVQLSEIDFDYPDSVDIRGYRPSVKGHTRQIKKVADAIEKAEHPLICAGGGVVNSGANDELKELAERCDIPVISTMMGISSISTCNELYYGMLGTHGVAVANHAIQNADLIILMGARVSDRAISKPTMIMKDKTIVHIDVDPAEIGKNVAVEIPVVGDCKAITDQLLEVVKPKEHKAWKHDLDSFVKSRIRPFANEDGFVNPKEFMEVLSKKAPDNSVVVADVGQNQIWAANNFKIKDGKFLTTGGFGTMGYSIPCAIGAKMADEDREVISVCGDGSFQMQMMELATICQEDVPVKVIVMKNNRLGMVRDYQTCNFADRQIAVSLDGSPNFATLASSYGIPSQTVDNIDDAKEAIDRMIGSKDSYLLEVIVSERETSL